jgi:hypothetical protein
MQSKKSKGFAVKAPPYLNPKNETNRYVYSGVEIASGEFFACSFSVIPLPGFTSPGEFAAVIAAHNPLPGEMEIFPPDWGLGKFSYLLSPITGGTGSARAEDIKSLSKEQLMPPPSKEPTQERIKTREVLQPAPRMPRHPALDQDMDMF